VIDIQGQAPGAIIPGVLACPYTRLSPGHGVGHALPVWVNDRTSALY